MPKASMLSPLDDGKLMLIACQGIGAFPGEPVVRQAGHAHESSRHAQRFAGKIYDAIEDADMDADLLRDSMRRQPCSSPSPRALIGLVPVQWKPELVPCPHTAKQVPPPGAGKTRNPHGNAFRCNGSTRQRETKKPLTIYLNDQRPFSFN